MLAFADIARPMSALAGTARSGIGARRLWPALGSALADFDAPEPPTAPGWTLIRA